MLILLPPSETKTPVRRGKPLDPDGLSFPPLAPTRAAVLDALIDVSAEPDATARLGVPASLTDVVRRNVALREAPTAARWGWPTSTPHPGAERAHGSSSSRRCGVPFGSATAYRRTA